jgi:hypothetical protein
MGIWALTVFRDGWRVLDHLGTTPEALVCYLLSRWRPRAWMEEADLLRIPAEMREHLEPDQLVFGPQDHALDLQWLGWRLGCGLTITGPIPDLSLPKVLVCGGDIRVEQVHALQAVRGLTVPGRQLTLKECPNLESIELPESTDLVVQGCPRVQNLRGKVTADLKVEDCSELVDLDIVFPKDALPAPSLVVRRCPKLASIGRASGVPRTCRDLIVEDCASFRGFGLRLIVRRERRITRCQLITESQ